MASRSKTNRSRRGLLALVVVALLLLFLATMVGGPKKGLQCAPLASTSAAEPVVEGEKPVLAPPTPGLPGGTNQPGAEFQTPPQSGDGRQVRGFVRDAAIGDPVPFVMVEVRAGQERERVPTDVAGAFASTREFAGEKLELEVFDGSTSYGVTALEWSPQMRGKSTTITIEIGPTFLVHDIGMRRVQEGDAWMLRLVQTPRPLHSAGEIAVRDQELSIALGPDIVWSEVPLRFAGEAAFARWAKVEFERMSEFRPRVEVRSAPRCERGAIEVGEPVGLVELPGVQTRKVLVLSGKVEPVGRQRTGFARVLVRPEADSSAKSGRGAPDFREVQTTGGRYEVEVAAGERYTVLAWSASGEPTPIERRVNGNGRYTVRDANVNGLSRPSFDPGVVPPEFARAVAAGQQLVRARVSSAGPFALPIVDAWEAFADPRPGSLLETRYEIESIGVDCAPATLGRTWKQILPGELVPDRLPSGVVARRHRIEWLDPRFNTARTDAHVTGGPGGALLTLKETTLAASWTVIPKCPLWLTVWKDGCEPVAVRSEDFAERGDESVASVTLRTGWGVLLTFVVIDSEVTGSGGQGWKLKSRGSGPRQTSSAMFDFLGYPPLPGVNVTSIQDARGESDANGCVLLHAATWPDRLTVRAPGYRLRELRRLPGAGARWIAYMEHDRYDP